MNDLQVFSLYTRVSEYGFALEFLRELYKVIVVDSKWVQVSYDCGFCVALRNGNYSKISGLYKKSWKINVRMSYSP